MEFLSTIDPRLAYILESLHDSHAVIFKDMSNIIQLVNTNKNSVSNRTEEKISSKINVSTNYTNEEVQQLLQTAEHFERQNLVINYQFFFLSIKKFIYKKYEYTNMRNAIIYFH